MPPDVVPRALFPVRGETALAGAARCLGSRPLPPDGRGVPFPRRGAAGKERLGPEPAQIEGCPDPGSRRRLRARRRRSIPSRAGCAGASRSQRPRGAARRPADGSLVRAPRVRVDGDSGRCRPCGCDRVAERVGRGRRGRLDQATRAATAAAERAARVLLAPRAQRVPPARARRADGQVESAARPLVSTRRDLGRCSRQGCCRGALQGRGLAERERAGDLRDRLPARVPARSATRSARRRAPARDGRRVDRALTGRLRAGAHRRDAHACARRGVRRSGPSRPPTRWPVPGTWPTASCGGSDRVLHAEGQDRVAPRRPAAGDRRGVRARRRDASLVADRGGCADDRDRARARHAAVRPRVVISGGLDGGAARAARARPPARRHAAPRDHGAALAGRSALRRRLATRAAARPCGLPAGAARLRGGGW